MTNEQLAHEVLLDPTFRLPAGHHAGGGRCSQMPALQSAHAALMRGFWAGLEDDLRLEPPRYGRALRVLASLRDSMTAVAGAAQGALLAELVDEDLLLQRADAGLAGWEEAVALLEALAAAIGSMRAERPSGAWEDDWEALRAAARAADCASRPGLLCRMLEGLLRQASAVRAEAANAKLRRLAPAIAEHGADYERAKFQARLAAAGAAAPLERTRAWLRAALRRAAAARGAGLLRCVAEGRRAALAEVLAAATAGLAAGECGGGGGWGGGGGVPETLQLDARRLRWLAAEFRRLLQAAAALVAAREALASAAGGGGRARAEAAAAEVARALLAGLGLGEAQMARVQATAEAATEAAVAAAASHLPGAAEAVRSATARRLAGPPDRVDALLRDRILGVWTLAAAGAREGDDGCGPAALGGALAGLWPGVWAAARRMGRMAAVNREVHGELYGRILREQAAALLAEAAPQHDSGPPPPSPDAARPVSPTGLRPGRQTSPRLGKRPAGGGDVCDRPLARRPGVVAEGSGG